MTAHNDFDRRIKTWFADAASEGQPAGLLETVLDATRARRSRPAWIVALRRGGMRATIRVGGQPLDRLAYLLVLAALVLALVAGLLLAVGGARRRTPSFGPAANGLIAFSREQGVGRADYAIFVANADGSGVRPIVTSVPGAHAPTFAPDGSRLAFWAGPWRDPGQTRRSWHLMVAETDGSNILDVSRDLSTTQDPGEAEPMINRIAWAPDSKRLVYRMRGADPPDRLVIASADGSGAHTLGDHAPAGFAPVWSPDGRWIAYVDLPSNAFRLHLIHPDGSGERLVPTSFDDRGGLSAEGGVVATWAPVVDQEQLLYNGGTDQGDIAFYDVLAERETVVSADPVNEVWETWSPDGKRIAWYWSHDGPDEIRVANADGSAPRAVYRAEDVIGGLIQRDGVPGPWAGLEHPFDCSRAPELLDRWFRWPPAWSPDGTKLLGFTPCHTAFLVITIDGSEPPLTIPAAGTKHWVSSWQHVAP